MSQQDKELSLFHILMRQYKVHAMTGMVSDQLQRQIIAMMTEPMRPPGQNMRVTIPFQNLMNMDWIDQQCRFFVNDLFSIISNNYSALTQSENADYVYNLSFYDTSLTVEVKFEPNTQGLTYLVSLVPDINPVTQEPQISFWNGLPRQPAVANELTFADSNIHLMLAALHTRISNLETA